MLPFSAHTPGSPACSPAPGSPACSHTPGSPACCCTLAVAQPVPLSAGDSVDDRPAASSADDLSRAFAADLAPLKDVIDASTSPDDCIRRVEEWVSKHNPSNAAEVIEKALYVYSMAGARSAQRPRTRKDGK